ncbi:SEFIR domain-containing protein [Jatrophihabitans lederbergiae]|uniref:SEFIR domain-containing protein n=1 Tax=Jatrophihabitans lederbergiae TaxID=3075547 RepID=A0ABU2JEI2_9ACTN|nr:SEFIR domain-containing protein [Jatrophihabitans sp. DSM 44399]MDT0263410.1 SEFIR domain-containing protein [Jatrophihabitans sp. DSM 44399]
MTPQPPTAFVTWAHSGAGWTQTQREDWAETVAQFAGALTIHGVDTDLDLYHLTEPGTDWTRYGPQAIESANFILFAVSQAWTRRFDGTEDRSVGAGASQEADALQGIYQRDREEFRRRVMLVYLPGADTGEVPATLHNLLRFTLPALTRPHLDDLLRALHGQPRYVRPALGAAPDFETAAPATMRAMLALNACAADSQRSEPAWPS